MTPGLVRLRSTGGSRTVALDEYLNPAAEELAHQSSHAWIKSLRHVAIDDQPLRDRFVVRGDSLWWFAELYLHKQRVILDLHRTIAALEGLIAQERPLELSVESGSVLLRTVTASVASAHGLRSTPSPGPLVWSRRLALLDLRARRFNFLARAAPVRFRRAPAVDPPEIAAFVHRAFWKSGPQAQGEEPYVGGVLRELEQQLGRGGVSYVGIGPTTNFRTRRRWAPTGSRTATVIPIERYASRASLVASARLWRARYGHFRSFTRSPAIRQAATIRGVDCWPLIREELAGIAWLQWPWSVRAMDEAAAALDALRPRLIFTYAEAGGWGRAIVLEARRRGIASVGLQHGFIYSHWLNYLHEEDEMRDGATRAFPAPTRTLVFDPFTAHHLRDNGRFPENAIVVTGSPHRDALVRAFTALTPPELEQALRTTGAPSGYKIVLLTTKEREARPILPALVAAVEAASGVWLVIKPHPAETSEAYAGHVAGRGCVTVVRPDTPLAPLLAICRVLVTVNSTVALDAAAVGVRGLVVGLPNNLSPLVEAGQLAGAWTHGEIRPALERILYDESFRQQLMIRQKQALGGTAAAPSRDAAAASADAILGLLDRRAERRN
jgi:hypothetical protein